METGWVLFACGLALAAAATLLALAGGGTPPLLVAAVAAAGGSYLCLRRSHERLTSVAYDRVGVERNPDGTVGEAGRAAEPSRSANIEYEPRDDWDDPDDWPFDDPFWTEAGGEDPPGPDEGPADWWERRTRTDRREGDGGTTTLAPREREACETLGVDVDAEAAEIRRAYRERVKQTHPDHGGDRETFKRVRWAYEYLQEHRSEM
ncbi:J domain-containing protein [Halosegnis sp.]|uniref:J domain-containing protein n=1 Tax=Halosegnis sp. TaxID=2864959 RepID=UPI0035D42C80